MFSNDQVAAILPAADLERTKKFYINKLGLDEPVKVAPATLQFECGEGSSLILYQRDAGTKADHTVAGWLVDDVKEAVDELQGRGIAFEQYDMPNLKTDKDGIAMIGQTKSAWFKDPEGNILCVHENLS